jgi:hypothetical protein
MVNVLANCGAHSLDAKGNVEGRVDDLGWQLSNAPFVWPIARCSRLRVSATPAFHLEPSMKRSP